VIYSVLSDCNDNTGYWNVLMSTTGINTDKEGNYISSSLFLCPDRYTILFTG